jgi:hypothetical protein
METPDLKLPDATEEWGPVNFIPLSLIPLSEFPSALEIPATGSASRATAKYNA